MMMFLLLIGCSSTKQLQPTVTTLEADSTESTQIKSCFFIPAQYIPLRCRLIIQPRLMSDCGEVLELYTPVTVDAPIYRRKLHRKEVLEGYRDSYEGQTIYANRKKELIEVPFEQTVVLPDSCDEAYVDAVIANEGCGDYALVDTLFIMRIYRPEEPVDTFSLSWMEPPMAIQEKVMHGKGAALLQFAINRDDIDPSRGNNWAELATMEQALSPVLKDSLASVQFIRISGMASADGLLAFNTDLARRRAESAKRWLTERLNIRPEEQALISTSSRSEGWEPVLDAMKRAGDADSTRVEEILVRYAEGGDDVQERHIRRLPCWNKIKDNYLQRDRKVEYEYAYTLRSFTTDRELKDMYVVRKDAFSEEEFFRLAELLPSLEEKIEVYRTLLRYYPQSMIGANNLAVLEHQLQKQKNGGSR